MKVTRKKNLSLAIMVGLIVTISALAYLPRVAESSFYRDDWYYILDRTIGGPGIFQEMFKIDRPVRGPLFELYYQFFGNKPLPYHISAYIWRLLSGLAALWLFHLLWPGRHRLVLTTTLLYTLYPGYLWWISGVEYQPMILSAFLQVLSYALTLQSLRSTRLGWQILSTVGAILTGWAYLALVDYAIGMEIFRLLCIYIVTSETSAGFTVFQKVKSAFRRAWIFLIIPMGYLGWRLFFFNSQRADTNLAVQIGKLLESPVYTGLWWLVHALQSLMNVALLAWGSPFYKAFQGLRLRDFLIGLALTAIAIFCTWIFITWQDRNETAPNAPTTRRNDQDSNQAILLGALGIFFGVLPVIIANRWVEFENFSHYALPASLASAILMAGLLSTIVLPRLRQALLLLLVGSAVFTHYATATRAVLEEQTIREFWWQVYWRAPNIQPGAVIAASYPEISIGEDRDIVWGPANMIYYPKQTGIPAHYVLTALATIPEILPEIQMGSKHTYDYRSSFIEVNYANLLVLSQPLAGACVHALDSRWPLISTADSALTNLIAPRSRIENIQLGPTAFTPYQPIFSQEPAHTWCYYYEKAELALQFADWQQVADLGAEASQQELRPVDRVEWMPFLQAYAHLGDEQKLRETAPRINESPFLRMQACSTLQKMVELGLVEMPQIQDLINELFCS